MYAPVLLVDSLEELLQGEGVAGLFPLVPKMLGKLRRELRGEVVGLAPSQALGEGLERGLGGPFCLLARLHMASGLYLFYELVVLH